MFKKYLKGPARFWQYVEKYGENDCWPWNGPLIPRKDGLPSYGVFTMNKPRRTSVTAHRQAFLLSGGIVPEGQIVRHRCDNPRCCNPKHLLAGTHQDNTNDMIDRGRADWQNGHKRRFGSRFKKLTDADVREIRRLRAQDGRKNWEIAPNFGISEKYVSALCLGRRKAHVI